MPLFSTRTHRKKKLSNSLKKMKTVKFFICKQPVSDCFVFISSGSCREVCSVSQSGVKMRAFTLSALVLTWAALASAAPTDNTEVFLLLCYSVTVMVSCHGSVTVIRVCRCDSSFPKVVLEVVVHFISSNYYYHDYYLVPNYL